MRWELGEFSYFVTNPERLVIMAEKLESMWDGSDDPEDMKSKLLYEKGPIPRDANNAEDWDAL